MAGNLVTRDGAGVCHQGRDSLGDVLLVGTEQGHGFTEPVVEEALACLLGMPCALEFSGL